MENFKKVLLDINTVLSIYWSALFLLTEIWGLKTIAYLLNSWERVMLYILYFYVENNNHRTVVASKVVYISCQEFFYPSKQ